MRKTAIVSGLTIVLTSLAAHAHESWSTSGESGQLTLEGAVASLQWENPNGKLTLLHDGKLWSILLAPPFRLQSRGLSPELLHPGTVVTAQGHVSRHDSDELRAERLIVDGETYELR